MKLLNKEKLKKIIHYGPLLFIIAITTTVLLVLFIINIFEKQQEAKYYQYKIHPIAPLEDDPKLWALDFPHQYDDYMKTVDQIRTRYGGSEALPRTPSKADPRQVVAQSKLEEDPRLKKMWAGYAFSKDFREERGHAYMLQDQLYTGRQAVPQPGSCLQCHSSIYKAMMVIGEGDVHKGFETLNKMPYKDAVKNVEHPVSCLDCHEPSTMTLRVTRPAFIDGIRDYKEHNGIKNYDVNKMATRLEMRTFVCAQCHVEYYFKGHDKQLTFPWKKGLKADEILSYYEENKHKDWIHEITGAPVIKAQHPEFEMWSQGIHGRSGVSCVDCHMPYKRVGATKISDHHIRSPLLNINRACQTCHNIPENELIERVEQIQGRHTEMRNTTINALMDLIDAIADAQKKKMAENKIKKAQNFQRQAQFLIDFAEAENSAGFHAPQEAARIMVKSIDFSRQGLKALK